MRELTRVRDHRASRGRSLLSARPEAGARPGKSEDGFTVIELMVAISLATVMFVGLAAIMATSLRTLAVTRSRGQANEVATQGSEDLQRSAFSSLVSCSTPWLATSLAWPRL